MRTRTLMVAETLEDLRSLTPGSRIATNNNKLLVLEQYKGRLQWYEPGELTSYWSSEEWLPAIILPSTDTERRNHEASTEEQVP